MSSSRTKSDGCRAQRRAVSIDTDGATPMTRTPRPISSLGAIRTFLRTGACSETVCIVVNDAFNQRMPDEEHAASPLAGGISQHGHQCGMLWGEALAAGAQAYRRLGAGPVAEAAAVRAAERVVGVCRRRTGFIDCYDVTGADWKKASRSAMLRFFVKGGPITCFGMAGGYSRQARDAIEASLTEPPSEVPEPPVSCASLLARRLGATDEQAAMAAGFAGGIGLSGGACGALGAAVWMFGLNDGPGDRTLGPSDPRVDAIVERYLESADYAFECSEVVGRRFESVSDHADHVRGGGCSKIIDALAA
jgi:hypothetical protein